MRIYQGKLTLHEHVYFSSHEIGILFASEPVIGNYALTYALGLCSAPYYWAGGPRYKEDLAPLNPRGIYVTPATFATLYYAFQQFNAQTDTYYSRFDQNAIGTVREQKPRPNNFPQNGKLRMLGLGSVAHCYVLSTQDEPLTLPSYIRLGKFQSKVQITWQEMRTQPTTMHMQEVRLLLNPVDMAPEVDMQILSLISVHPTPLIGAALLSGQGWHIAAFDGQPAPVFSFLPQGMHYGVEVLP
jgi:CRISPR-associated protein Csc1